VLARSDVPGSAAITTPAVSAPTGDRVARGIAVALITFTIFSCADALVKWLSARYSIFQIIFIGTLFALIPATVLIARRGGVASLKPRHPWLVGMRAFLMAADIVLVFFAFTRLPLADAYTLLFAAPMVVTALSVPLLGEHVGWRRWLAVIVGFGGVLIVLRPGFADLDLGHLAALSSALFFGLSIIFVRRIGAKEGAGSMLVWMMLAFLVVSAPVLPNVYVAPSASDLALLAAFGLLTGVGHLGLIEAFRIAPSAVIAPFHYSQMIWAVIFGLFLFGDVPSDWVIGGSAVIIGSGLFILWRETVRRREKSSSLSHAVGEG
jgi:S-adenosylmethionine uptake transporter